MKSYRELVSQLTGVRLAATNVSLWAMAGVLEDYARTALNDAVSTFPVHIELAATHTLAAAIPLPAYLIRVTRVTTLPQSGEAQEVIHWDFYPATDTAFLCFQDSLSLGQVAVYGSYQQPLFPPKVYVTSDSITTVNCSGGDLLSLYPAGPAHIELYYTSQSRDYREVVRYTTRAANQFSGLTRQIEGKSGPWPSGAQVSLCLAAPDNMVRPVELMAQAVLYETFLRHRALYDQYTAIASIQALGLDDLQTLIRDLEARARLAYTAANKPSLPRPTGWRLDRARSW